ncbi:hypothetical protein B0A58_14390 [Flavobacterium branchiophilum NBRC 15030 = ATCC 35035]|uniref:Lipoprotein n=1 Tax=Flavobacterium branchiophilum TaxID=55197 RepID=A0A543FZV5_9FLAO|nr:hypothetical protein [Flavobacterium branchiophilum]OXA70514.1 hypothetical protein B0A58_14390 [Flavobacterium branchiophilum NBRC 15030 = ATCC 35035]TQM39284.1 hypothetical protein BC670_0060 [Flavobacterium branchiophilum]GEM56704.1 hypothetical protein FB1_29250 [Flavobacterium branchiophilum NBRC 15030 = ATCC 35035]
MMKSILNYLIITIIILLSSCKPSEKVLKNISCSGNVILQYDKIKQSDKSKQIANKDLKAFTVYFLDKYKDSIQGYVNNKLCYVKYLNMNGNSDSMNEYFGYNYSKDVKMPVLKIVSKTKNTCFDLDIDINYKIIYVYLSDEGNWIVRFSNVSYLY